MKNLKMSILSTVVLSLVTYSSGPAHAQAIDSDSTLAASSIKTILDAYRSVKSLSPREVSQDEDIVLACFGGVFLDWSNAYLAVLKSTTKLDARAIGQLGEFGQLYYHDQYDQLGFESFRPGLLKAVGSATQLAAQRLGVNSVNGLKLTLNNIFKDQYIANLKVCASDPFLSAAHEALATPPPEADANPSQFLPQPEIYVAWTCNAEGGLEMTPYEGAKPPTVPQGPCEPDSGSLSSVSGIVPPQVATGPAAGAAVTFPRAANYQSFLDQIIRE